MRVWLVLWSLGAVCLAYLRVPYDDEWFTIELAQDTTRAQFWQALNGDVHPPWLALLDRGIAGLWGAPIALQLSRIAAVALSIALLARSLRERLQLPAGAFVLAACHPIVLFYAGSARWYPFLLLAHVLRLHAVWHEQPTRRAGAFIGGSLLGSATTYLDALFLAHDCVWFVCRARRQHARWRAIAPPVVAAAGCVPLLLWLSPLQTSSLFTSARHSRHSLASMAQWAGLGLAGETALPLPFTWLGLACVIAAAGALVLTCRSRTTRCFGGYVLSYTAAWIAACTFGVAHPRYSLLLWISYMLLVLSERSAAAPWLRLVNGLGACQLAIALLLAASGRGFFKADLNALAADDCTELHAADHARALIVPYRRIAALARRECGVHTRILGVPSIRMQPEEAAQLAGLRRELAVPGEYYLISYQTRSSLALTQARVQELLMARCTASPVHSFGKTPHAGLSPERSSAYRRFSSQRFVCGAD